MGFRPPVRTFLLVFDDPDLEGLEVRARAATYGEVLSIVDVSEQEDGQKRLDEMFVKYVTDWNLEDSDGVPMSVSTDTLKALDPLLAKNLVTSWFDNVIGEVEAPLGQSSTGGATPVEDLSGLKMIS